MTLSSSDRAVIGHWWKPVPVFICLMLAASQASAQQLTYEAGYFAPGVNPATGGQPIQVVQLTTTCNQPFTIVVTTRVANPIRVEWDDPLNPTKACKAALDPTTVLASFPVGLDYQFGLRAVDSIQTKSAWVVLPFDWRRVVPPPTGVRIGS